MCCRCGKTRAQCPMKRPRLPEALARRGEVSAVVADTVAVPSIGKIHPCLTRSWGANGRRYARSSPSETRPESLGGGRSRRDKVGRQHYRESGIHCHWWCCQETLWLRCSQGVSSSRRYCWHASRYGRGLISWPLRGKKQVLKTSC